MRFWASLGSKLELLDLYLTRDGWAAFDALDAITVALSALAGLIWWVIARTLCALVRRVIRVARALEFVALANANRRSDAAAA